MDLGICCIVSICGHEHVSVVCEDAESVVWLSVWKEVFCENEKRAELGCYNAYTGLTFGI